MKQKIAIHETAFVTSAFRAADVELSMDQYAGLWPNATTEKHAKRYTDAVSEYEPFAHCLRNRFFYEKINELFAAGEIEILINFGCGFSMYPFLLHENLVHIEIDQPDVISYKKKKVAQWQRNNNLPERKIHYISSNFNDEDFSELLSNIEAIKKDRPSFILIEGVLFFLGASDTQRLFNLFDGLHKKGEFIGSVSYRKSLEKTVVFQRMIDFIEENLEKNVQFQYQMLDDIFYENLKNYRLTDHQDTLSMAKTYAPDRSLGARDVLIEHMYLLKKL